MTEQMSRFFKDRCNLLTYGSCETYGCVVRGKVDMTTATCLGLEIHNYIVKLEAEIEDLEVTLRDEVKHANT